MWPDMSAHGWGWMIFGGLHWLVFWLLVILAILALVKWLSGGPSKSTGNHKTALNILQERYARGEIDREEYLRIKADLEK